jgi:hypothetical protein
MRPLRSLPPLLVTFLATGCATVLHGSRQNVRVETDPPGATASAVGRKITTPGVLKLPRKEKTLEVLVEKDGYVSRRVTLTRKASGAGWANLLFMPAGAAIGASFCCDTSSDASVLELMVGRRAAQAFIAGVALPAAAFVIDSTIGGAYRLDPPTIVLRLEAVSAARAAGD